MCRHIDACISIQYDCNTECWLLYVGCTSFRQSTCGSSAPRCRLTLPFLDSREVYSRTGGQKGQSYALSDGHSFIAYSATMCEADDCLAEAVCPTGTWPTECNSIPPNQQDGVWQNGTRCVAQGSGEGPYLAQALCSDLFETTEETSVTEAAKYLEGEITVSCSVGSAVSCTWARCVMLSGREGHESGVGGSF